MYCLSPAPAGIVQHEGHALPSRHVGYLVGIGAHGGGAPGENGTGRPLGDEHGALHMHVRVIWYHEP